jgi:phosphohistidine phosphatase
MKLYLLRHGVADWPNWDRPDDERPLTKKGRKEMRRMAKFLRELKIKPAIILSSPLPRAWQTAEIAADYLELELRREDGLKSGFNTAKLKTMLKPYAGEDVMIVGHEPDFTAVIRDLTGGRTKLAKGGVALLELANGIKGAQLRWLLPPKVAR